MPPAFRPLLALAFCLLPFAFLSAQTIGQYELRKRTSTGFTAYGITLSNGQVIGQTAGIPAAITPLVSGDLSAYLTSATAASTYQPLDADLTSIAALSTVTFGRSLLTLADAAAGRTSLGLIIGTNVQAYDAELASLASLSNAAGLLTNNGSGTLSYTATSTGGNGASDSTKLITFGGNGGLSLTRDLSLYKLGALPGLLQIQAADGVFAIIQAADGMGTFRTITLPSSDGTLITTGDTGTVTSTMLAGSIANSKLATDPLNASNLTSGTVPTARLGSGTANSTTYLRGDNTWATVTGGVTSITGTANEITVTGTTTPTLSLPSALTFTGKTITGGTFSSPTLTTPALGTPSAIVLTNATGSPAGISLTKAQLNTIVSDDDPAYVGTAQTFSAVQTLLSVRLGSTTGVYLRDGYEYSADVNQRGCLILASSDGYGRTINSVTTGAWNNLGAIAAGNGFTSPYYSGKLFYSSTTATIYGGSNITAIVNSTSAQLFRVNNTFTSDTNLEAFAIDWQTTANVCRVGPVAGSGGGTVRTARYYLNSTVWMGVGSGSPEGVETAGIGSTFHRTDGGAGTSFYVKESGTGNTGWIPK